MAAPGRFRQIRQQPGTQGFLSWRHRQLLVAFLFILPALINFTVFRYIPILASIRASLYQYSLLGGYKDFIGLDHYARMLGDATFWQSLRVTVALRHLQGADPDRPLARSCRLPAA